MSRINHVSKFVNVFLIYCLTLLSIGMPAGTSSMMEANLKIVFLLIILFINFVNILYFFHDLNNLYYLFFSIFFPGILVILSAMQQPIGDVIQGVYVFSFIWLLPVLRRYEINYLKIVLSVLTIISIIICLSSLLDYIGIMSIDANPILSFLQDTGNAQISKSSNAIFLYVIFLKASPLILILLMESLVHKKYVIVFIAEMALLLTGTRANIYISVIVLFIYVLFFVKRRIIKIIFITLFVGGFVKYDATIYEKIVNINAAKSTGDAIRMASFGEIFETMNQNPISYLVGNGIGSTYFSSARGGMTSGSELSYLEFFRQVGLLGSMFFLYFIVKPIFNLIQDKKNRWFCVSYVGYLAIAFTEPFIFTSTGFVLYLLAYDLIYTKSKP